MLSLHSLGAFVVVGAYDTPSGFERSARAGLELFACSRRFQQNCVSIESLGGPEVGRIWCGGYGE